MTPELEELKKKLRAYEEAKVDWSEITALDSSYREIAEKHDKYCQAFNDLHDFIFQGNITSEDIK